MCQFTACAEEEDEDEDRAEAQRILADPEIGPCVRGAAQALAGTATHLRQFLTVGLARQRGDDYWVKLAQIVTPPSLGETASR
ncbi:ALF repeat-containing protein [Kitasatospora sp. NPDC101176]|uniref:ALF repeat-containing protein n=1 Tax=Kitasatospora sp. NPDC101176 TaxID=3364099 RepID=UPI00380C925C